MKDIRNEELKIKLKNLAYIFVGCVIYVFAINMFITPAGLYTGGVTGIAQLVIAFVKQLTGYELSLGGLVFLMNLPLLVLAWKSISRRFATLSILVVVLQTILLEIIPVGNFSDDILLNGVFGGLLIGVGVGMILKVGGSSGGMDIVSQYISMKYNGSVGTYSFAINVVIVLIAGITQSWEIALYTIISIYITSVLMDKIHTIHKNLTLYIVTNKEDEMCKAIYNHLYRGITVLEGRGAYTKHSKSVLMIVLSSYEMYEVLEIIKEVDETAFTNVVRSELVQGNYVKKKIK